MREPRSRNPESLTISIKHRLLAILLVFISQGANLSARPLEVTIGDITVPGTYNNEQWLTFERRIDQDGRDAFALRMLIQGQLGSEEQLMSGLRRGRIQFASVSALFASTVVPEAALLYGSYLFDSYEEADFVYDHYLTTVFTELLAEQGLHLVAWNEVGFHHIYAKTPIHMPEDVAGRRFRVSASPASTLLAQTLRADVIPLNYGELVVSLQTGLIEAGENGATLYATSGVSDEAPHLTLTRHAYGVSLIVSAKSWWNRLSDRQQEILDSAYPGPTESRPRARAETREVLGDAVRRGFFVHELNHEQLASWRAATAETAETLANEIGGRAPEIYAMILEGKRAFQAARTTHQPAKESEP